MDSSEHDQKSRAEDDLDLDLDLRLGRRLIEKERELFAGGASAVEAAQLAKEFGASKLIEAATQGLSMLRVELDERLDAVEDANGRYRARLVDHWAEGLDR